MQLLSRCGAAALLLVGALSPSSEGRVALKAGSTWATLAWGFENGGRDSTSGMKVLVVDPDDAAAMASIPTWKQAGHVISCYLSVGSVEPTRPDILADLAAWKAVELVQMAEWEEWWIDFRQLSTLQPLIQKRFDRLVQLGCDVLEPDNMDGYQAPEVQAATGQSEAQLRAAQVAFNVMIADMAHAADLSVILKNSVELMPDLADYFDGAVSESCQRWNECGNYVTYFASKGKAVFAVEYVDPASPSASCSNFPAGVSGKWCNSADGNLCLSSEVEWRDCFAPASPLPPTEQVGSGTATTTPAPVPTTAAPTAKPTAKPSAKPSAKPTTTATPTAKPTTTATPTAKPTTTATPTAKPTTTATPTTTTTTTTTITTPPPTTAATATTATPTITTTTATTTTTPATSRPTPKPTLATTTTATPTSGKSRPTKSQTSPPSSLSFSIASSTGETCYTASQLAAQQGTVGDGQAVASLAVRDQSGTDDTWASYIEFAAAGAQAPNFLLKVAVPASTLITGVRAELNFKGPLRSWQLWQLSVVDATGARVPVLDNTAATAGWTWTLLAGTAAANINPSSGLVQFVWSSPTSIDASQLDYAKFCFSSPVTASAVDVDVAATQQAPPSASPSPLLAGAAAAAAALVVLVALVLVKRRRSSAARADTTHLAVASAV